MQLTVANKDGVPIDGEESLEGTVSESEIRRGVRQWYAKASGRAPEQCCCETGVDEGKQIVLSEEECCSLPLNTIEVREGMVVVDLGSGLGRDAFLASKLVGPTGKVIGVDATPEMVWKAREIAKTGGYADVEFRLGEIERLPIESAEADLVISNCVINLMPDKARAFEEASRILRSGGKLIISDVVSVGRIPVEIRKNLRLWSACVGGVLEEEDYVVLMKKAGFREVEVKERHEYHQCWGTGIGQVKLFSTTFVAQK